ncbi:MAG TPA: hypothetical protein VD863_17115 [Bradyrhizobium sp.]|jgi:hypothetical protein|nr:hypothetical protein [Bradyrhizobium sp.]
MNDLSTKFSSLEPNAKAMFLARVVHMATIAAREAYTSCAAHPERSYDRPEGIILRDANEFVHRVAGYVPQVLDRTETPGQDQSVLAMIENYYRTLGLAPLLADWLTGPDSPESSQLPR